MRPPVGRAPGKGRATPAHGASCQPSRHAARHAEQKAEKGEKTIKVGKKGDVKFDVETLVGDLRLKPGRYQIQHRTDGPDHFVHFTEVTKTGSTVAHPGEVKCRLETLDDKVPFTAVYTRQEGASERVTKVLIGGENVAHLF